MKRSDFINLHMGDRVQIGTIKYTVLQNKLVFYGGEAGETMIHLTPDDDNYVRKVGHLDQEVPSMRKLEEGE